MYLKIWSLIFPEVGVQWKFILFATFLHKSRIWKKFCSRDMGQNALGQEDYRVFKSNISLEQSDKIA